MLERRTGSKVMLLGRKPCNQDAALKCVKQPFKKDTFDTFDVEWLYTPISVLDLFIKLFGMTTPVDFRYFSSKEGGDQRPGGAYV